jgi:hypothetical protein
MDSPCPTEASAKPAENRKQRSSVGRFTERTEQWFEQGDQLAEFPENLPEALVDEPVYQPWWNRLAGQRVAIAAASAAGLLALVAWAATQ